MVCDLPRALDGARIQPFNRVGDAGMQVLPARGRDAGKERAGLSSENPSR